MKPVGVVLGLASIVFGLLGIFELVKVLRTRTACEQERVCGWIIQHLPANTDTGGVILAIVGCVIVLIAGITVLVLASRPNQPGG